MNPPNYTDAGQTHIAAFRNPEDLWGDYLTFALYRRADPTTLDQKFQMAELVWSDRSEYGVQAPTFKIRQQDGQKLMDSLWGMGIRPSDIGTPGHLSATQAHLNDFRVIVAKQLGVELK